MKDATKKQMGQFVCRMAQDMIYEQNIYHNAYITFFEHKKYEEALEAVEKGLRRPPALGVQLGFRAAVLGHLEKGPEAKAALDRYLALRLNLKTRDDYRRIFIPNSALADPIIEGLIKAGWEPEG